MGGPHCQTSPGLEVTLCQILIGLAVSLADRTPRQTPGSHKNKQDTPAKPVPEIDLQFSAKSAIRMSDYAAAVSCNSPANFVALRKLIVLPFLLQGWVSLERSSMALNTLLE